MEKTYPVLAGLREYVDQHGHVLLMGIPGSGKSTAMIRFLLETADDRLRGRKGPIPVLIELRYWQATVLDRIRAFLCAHDPHLVAPDEVLTRLLRHGRFLLLCDGINELPSDEARTALSAFRSDHPHLRMIFTTRAFRVAEALGIEHALQMLPLSPAQITAFINAYARDRASQVLRQIEKHNLQQFCETPLLLWMLCEVFLRQPDYEIHSLASLAAIFRRFVSLYEEGSVRNHHVPVLKGD